MYSYILWNNYENKHIGNCGKKGIEAMNMIKKGQMKNLNYFGLNEVKYINQLFGIIL